MDEAHDEARVCVICGGGRVFFNDDRCEDCWAVDQRRYHGYSQSVRTDRVGKYESLELATARRSRRP